MRLQVSIACLFYMNLKKNETFVSVSDICLAGALLLHLLDWVRLHKSDVDTRAREVLQSDSPTQHRSYWDVV